MTTVRRFASIDVGSHTVRLLIAACTEAGELTPLVSERRVTRLARGFHNGEMLQEATMQDSISVIEEYSRLLERCGVDAVASGATGVVRRAVNGEAFLRAVRERTGIDTSVVSEESEAFLSAKGILSSLKELPETIVAFDLGGSSTEILLINPALSQPLWSTSVFMGAATATERYLRGDPTEAASILEARSAIRKAFSPTFSTLEDRYRQMGIPLSQVEITGTAGTVTTLGAMHIRMKVYEPYRVSGMRLHETWLDGVIGRLATMPVASRSDLPGLEKGREDIILGGALIVREILRGLQKEHLTVSDAGLLEGLLLYLIENEYNWSHTLGSHLTWQWQRE